MKSVIKSIWQISKILLTHFFIIFAYTIGAGFYYGVVMGLSGKTDDIEAGVQAFLAPQTAIAVIIAALVAFLIYQRSLKKKGLNIFRVCRFNAIHKGQVLASITMGASILFLSLLVLELVSYLLPDSYGAHVSNMESIMVASPLIVILSVGVAAPLIEEVMFRGLVLRELEKKTSIMMAIFVQAAIFGIYHMNIAHSIMATLVGVFLGLSLYWTGSIWAPMLIHLVNNLLSVALELSGFSVYLEANPFAFRAIQGGMALIILPLSVFVLYRSRTVWIAGEDHNEEVLASDLEPEVELAKTI